MSFREALQWDIVASSNRKTPENCSNNYFFFKGFQNQLKRHHHYDMGVSKNRGTPKSSSLIGFSIIFTIHFGVFPPIFGLTPTYCDHPCGTKSHDPWDSHPTIPLGFASPLAALYLSKASIWPPGGSTLGTPSVSSNADDKDPPRWPTCRRSKAVSKPCKEMTNGTHKKRHLCSTNNFNLIFHQLMSSDWVERLPRFDVMWLASIGSFCVDDSPLKHDWFTALYQGFTVFVLVPKNLTICWSLTKRKKTHTKKSVELPILGAPPYTENHMPFFPPLGKDLPRLEVQDCRTDRRLPKIGLSICSQRLQASFSCSFTIIIHGSKGQHHLSFWKRSWVFLNRRIYMVIISFISHLYLKQD